MIRSGHLQYDTLYASNEQQVVRKSDDLFLRIQYCYNKIILYNHQALLFTLCRYRRATWPWTWSMPRITPPCSAAARTSTVPSVTSWWASGIRRFKQFERNSLSQILWVKTTINQSNFYILSMAAFAELILEQPIILAVYFRVCYVSIFKGIIVDLNVQIHKCENKYLTNISSNQQSFEVLTFDIGSHCIRVTGVTV